MAEVDGFLVERGQMSCSMADVVNQKGLPRGMAILTSYHRDLHDQGGGFAPITHVIK